MRIVIDIDPATGAAELTRAETSVEATPTSTSVAAAVDAGACAGISAPQSASVLGGRAEHAGMLSIPPAPHLDRFGVPGVAHAPNGVNAGSPPI